MGQLAVTKKMRATPYHPLINGQCERFNSTPISMIGTLQEQEKSHQKNQVATLVYTYKCKRSATTGFSPNFHIFGRYPRLMLDVDFGVNFVYKESVNTEKYMDNLRSLLNGHTKLLVKPNKKKLRNTKEYMTRTLDVPNWNQGI